MVEVFKLQIDLIGGSRQEFVKGIIDYEEKLVRIVNEKGAIEGFIPFPAIQKLVILCKAIDVKYQE